MPSAPIFVVDREGGDILAFPNVRAAAGYMEPPEVEAGEYAVFDSAGHVGTPTVRRFDVVLESWSEAPDSESFWQVLAAFVHAHSAEVPESVDLEQLVAAAYRLAQREKLERTRPRILIPVLTWVARVRHRREAE